MHMTASGQGRKREWLWRLVLAVHLGIASGYVGLWAMLATRGQFWQADFSAYYAGWSIVRDGHGAHLYDLDLQARYQENILNEGRFEGGVLPYLNPPYATLPFVSLALLSRSAAFWLWSLGQLLLLVWLLRVLSRLAQNWSPRERWLLFSGMLAFPPLFITCMLGTFSLLILVCVLHYVCALRRGHEGRAGLWLVLGTIKPQLMALPGLVVVGGRRWRALASVLLAGGVLVLVSGLLLGWASWIGFFQALQTVNTLFGEIGIVPTVMYNLKGTLALILGNEQGVLINRISMGAMVAASLATLAVWRGAWPAEDDPRFDLRMSLTLLLGLLFLPHLNPHDGLLLVLPALLFYRYLRQRNLPRGPYTAFVLSWPLLFLFSEFTVGGSLGIRGPVVAMGVLLIWIGKAMIDEARRDMLPKPD